MRVFVLTIIAGATALVATPAASQSWRIPNWAASEVRQDIYQLDQQINRARQRGTVSPREAVQLRRQTQTVKQLYSRYSRNGLNREEVSRLEREVNQVRVELRLARRDWDGRR